MNNLSPSILDAMKAALEEGYVAKEKGELAFGAVVICPKGKIVSRAHDTVYENNDPTRHAETDAVRYAIRNVGMDLSSHTLVCVGEPCAMCSSAAWWSGIRDIVYGISMAELKELVPESMPEPYGPIEILNQELTDKINVTSGVMRDEVLRLWDVVD